MIVEALFKYAHARDLIPSAFDDHLITYTVDLDRRGDFLGLVSEKATISAPKHGKRSGTNPKPYMLDKVSYTLGLDTKRPDCAQRQHEAFKALIRDLQKDTGEQRLAAVSAFLDRSEWPAELLAVAWKGPEKIGFRVEGTYVYDVPLVRRFFEQLDEGEKTHTCMITGEPCVPAFQPRLKNLPGSQGATLVTFNSPTARFHGRDAISSYPLSSRVQEGAVAAWNHLTEYQEHVGRRSALVIRKATGRASEPKAKPIMAFWTVEPEVNLEPLLQLVRGFPKEGDSEEECRANFKKKLRAALDSLATLEAQDAWLYMLTLQAFQGRAAVQDWTVLPVAEAARNLQRFFELTFMGSLGNMARMMPSYEESILTIRSVMLGRSMPSGLAKRLLHSDPSCWPDTHGRAPDSLLEAIHVLGDPQ